MNEKVVIVTGAAMADEAGYNIGGATAADVVAEGGRVVVTGRNAEGGERLAAHLNEKFGAGSAVARPVDLMSEDQIADLITFTVGTFGALDVLMNIAALFHPQDGDLASISSQTWDTVMGVNLRGTMLTTKYALPELLKSRGVIVNTSSTHALAGDTSFTAYGASKAAVLALTQYTATQYGAAGVRCNVVVPGVTTSPKVQLAPEPVLDIYRRHTPAPTLNTPEEVAKVYTFLGSSDSASMNGAQVQVDAGMFAHQSFTPDTVALGKATTDTLG
nr:SDR family oxidoreductase [Kineosporia babensis]